jgi:hypothetical protein
MLVFEPLEAPWEASPAKEPVLLGGIHGFFRPLGRRRRVRCDRLILIMVSLWDGPGPVPKVYGLEVAKLLPKRGIFRKSVAFQPRCGLRLPDPCQRRP